MTAAIGLSGSFCHIYQIRVQNFKIVDFYYAVPNNGTRYDVWSTLNHQLWIVSVYTLTNAGQRSKNRGLLQGRARKTHRTKCFVWTTDDVFASAKCIM